MTHIFTLKDLNDFSEKIDLDELYEKKQHQDLLKLEIFNKILHRIHGKIKQSSRLQPEDQFCWFVIPETIIGVPKYDQGHCIGYLIEKLKTNGFIVKYFHPNLFFICWKHWVPSYVRTEIKKKIGVNVDGFGNVKDKKNKDNDSFPLLMNGDDIKQIKKPKVSFKSIDEYQPKGNFIYTNEIVDEFQSKFR